MFHPERHTLFTSLTLFNPFLWNRVKLHQEVGLQKKNKQTKKKIQTSNYGRGVVFPNFQPVLCNMMNTFWREYRRIFDNFTSFDIQKPQ